MYALCHFSEGSVLFPPLVKGGRGGVGQLQSLPRSAASVPIGGDCATLGDDRKLGSSPGLAPPKREKRCPPLRQGRHPCLGAAHAGPSPGIAEGKCTALPLSGPPSAPSARQARCSARSIRSDLPRHDRMLLAGCGVSRTSDSKSSSPPENTIERKAEKGPVKLFVRVSPREPRLSDLVEMEVRVESQPDVEIKPPAFGQAVGDFIVRDYSERPAEAGAGNVRRFHYQLEPAHAGRHLIRSVSIEFVDKRPNSERRGEPALIETDPLEVNVTSELGNEAPSLANLEPMVHPRPVPQTFAIGWLVAAVLVVGARDRRRRSVPPA